MNASRVSPTLLIDVFKLVQSVLVKFANGFPRPKVGDPNDLETKLLRFFASLQRQTLMRHGYHLSLT